MEDQSPAEVSPVAPTPEPGPLEPVQPTTTKINWFVSILFLVLGILIGVGGYWAYQNYLAKGPTAPPSPTPTATPDVTANWKTYMDTKNNFSFKYPETYQYLTLSNGVVLFLVILLFFLHARKLSSKI